MATIAGCFQSLLQVLTLTVHDEERKSRMAQTPQDTRRGAGVVVACRRDDGRWLMIRRSTLVRAPLRVCFPGGWIDPGETQFDAARREMREELGVDVTPLQCVWRHVFSERSLTLWGWLGELQSPTLTPDPKEVHEVLWLTSDEAVHHPDVLPHTELFIAALLKTL